MTAHTPDYPSHLFNLHDRAEIGAFLRHDPREIGLHLYELGDLDDFFWPHTRWYGAREGGQANGRLQDVILTYFGGDTPVLLGLSNTPGRIAAMLGDLRPDLPTRLYAHLSGDAIRALAAHYLVEEFGLHHKMLLTDPTRLDNPKLGTDQAVPIGFDELPALERLYAAAYPGNFFDPRMLLTGQYYAIRDPEHAAELISAAGVHVYSPEFGVAALGNITTHPAHRGRGLAVAVTARLCQALRANTALIGLNVKASNASAIACYQKLGFTVVADYHEYALTRADPN
jgi:ribosomal protein S18 acetylase RimI-like enzyme